MKKIILFAAIAFAAAVSCTREIAPEETPIAPKLNYKEITLNANLDLDSKGTLDGKKVVWEVGEEVAVFTSASASPELFVVKSVENSNVSIVGSVPEGATSFIAAYPYSQAVSCAEGVVKMTVADQEVSSTVKVDPKALQSVAYFASATDTPMFRNTLALVAFSVGEEDVTSVTLTPVTSGAFAGEVSVTMSATDVPAVSAGSVAGVTVSNPDGFTKDATYYATIVPGAFEGLQMSAVKDGKAGKRVTTASATVARNQVLQLGDVIGSNTVWKYALIKTVDDLNGFLAEADTYDATDEVKLANDIDCSSATIAPAASFNGVFDGQGFTIKNLSISEAAFSVMADKMQVSPLFLLLDTDGVVQNVKVDAGSKITWNTTIKDETKMAFIVGESNGKVLNCEVAGDITIKSDSAGRLICAGVVAQSYKGYIEGCKFTGKIDVELTTTSQSVSSIGGVASRVGHTDMAGKVIVKDCVNEGSVKFLFSGATEQMKKFGIGGVIGLTPTVANAPSEHGIIEGCVNKGTVEWSYPVGGKGSYPAMGGVIGACEGQIRGCSNYGSIKYTGGKSIAATDASFGCVAGYVTGNASDCHNYGQMIIDAGIAGGTAMAQGGGNTQYSSFGGVFGGAGPFMSGSYSDMANNSSTEVTVENCTNEVAFEITPSMISTGGPVFCCGGVVGAATAHLVNCHNKADILIKSNTKFILGGALAGFTDANVTNCTNTGNLVVDGDKDNNPINAQQHYVGGLIGVAARSTVISNCQNSGNTTLQNVVTYATAYNYLGGINGGYSGSKLTMQNCTNSGTVTANFDGPLCFGGLSGGFNGLMKECQNSGDVVNMSSYTSTGKESEVGGLIGYANADIDSCINSGSVSSACTNGAVGGFVGGFGEAEKTFTGVSDAPVSGVNAGSIFGWFRKDTEHTITLGTSSSAMEVTSNAKVNGAAPTIDSIVGKIKSGKTNNVNLLIGSEKFVLFSEDLTNNKFTYAGKEYPLVKLADDRWWMAAPMAYVPAGKTVSSNPVEDAGIWHTYTVSGGVATPSTDDNGYLYDYPTALGLELSDITYGTQNTWTEGNYRDFEGAQGICPPGWYIPTYSDFIKLVGSANADSTRGLAAADDASALYYVSGYKGSTVKRFNEVGWNFSFLGARNKTSTTATGAYNVTLIDDTKCNTPEWYGKPALNQIMSSTAYKPNATGTSFQIFALMSTYTSTYPDGRLTLSYAQYVQGVELRCIRKAD
ncbi:MAG: hypothetical protein J5640_01380 [Bacteroidales bacterium]|nr:hypothetical protein [Bacteroidales bacterium]